MPNLLHLSDLHFGYDKDDAALAERAESLRLLVKELGKLKKEWKPDILVISGDLTWQGKPGGYTELAAWLRDALFKATGLGPADCIVCPGNHDIDREEARWLQDRARDAAHADALLNPRYLAGGFAKPFAAFAKFAADLGIPPFVLSGEPNYLAGARELHGLRFLCVNSAWFCRNSNTDLGQLWLGKPQLDSMRLMDEDDYDTAPVTVAVLHHPQDWLASPEKASYGDRPASYGYLAARTHVILSGHTHGAIERSSRPFDRARLFVGGAAYDNHQYRNNFSILEIDPKHRTVIRRPWELDPRVPKWEEKEHQPYSLRIEKPERGHHANPAKYLAWLQDKTRSIELNQLHVAPQETPPPAIDTLFIKLTTAGPARDGGAPGRPEPVPLEEALRNHRRLVIEGKPGCGKTTFVRWLAWMLCRPAGPPAELLWLAGFPIWVRISELDQHIANTLARPQPGDPATPVATRWIAHFLASQGWELDEGFFAEKFQAEATVLLLDGLDEAGNHERRVDMVKMVQEAAGQFGCRIVVTTRPGVHEGRATLKGFGLASIDDLDPAGIDGFLLQWCRWLKGGDEAAAQAYYTELRPAVAVPGIRTLARNPLMLTSLAVLHFRRHRLPEQRVKLYEQILDWLAEQAVDKHRENKKDAILERLGRLALGMQEWKGGQKISIGVDDAAALLTAKKDSPVPMRQFLEQAQIDSGIVTLRGGEIAFWHRSFQEYLAAQTLANLPDEKIPTHARKMLYSAEGREVLPLLAGCMAEKAKGRLNLVFENLTRHAAAQKRLERKAHAAGVLGNMLADVLPFDYELSGPAVKLYFELRDAVMVIFEKGKARDIGVKTRAAAAEALDQASQARLHLPCGAAYWKDIRGGKFTIGGDPEAFQSLPKRSVTVGTFQIGRFPVTVWEYDKYLDETGTEPPPDWDDQSRHPSRPVVSVTWYQAQDYCKWAKCKLPTDEQWEFAARGAEGRIFPWGPQEPDEHRANFNNIVREPTPVGMFPDGDTPEEVADMAGNVWEWTSSDFDKDMKSVRGASFFNVASYLRAAYRFRCPPVLRLNSLGLGFRCVRE